MSAGFEAHLADWLPRQRWFGGKDAAIRGVRRLDQAPLGGGARVILAEAGFERQPPEIYQIVADAAEPDVLGREAVRARWWDLLATGGRIAGANGEFQFDPFEALAPAGSSRLLGAEQSNTSLLYADPAGRPQAILKLFRRLQPGENPEAEVPRALARWTSFRQAPRAMGEARYQPSAGGESYTLAVVQSFVPNEGDGWSYVLRRLAAGAPPAEWERTLHRLGERTAELHQALAAVPGEAFAPEAITPADAEYWRQRALQGVAADFPPEQQKLLAPWREELASGFAGAEAACGAAKIRIHGDYHLGQVLRAADDFMIFDFEGEPARPIAARRRKSCVLQDVAGMLRSFSYAAHTAGRLEWEAPARDAFLAGYGQPSRSASWPLLPAPPQDCARALRFFEIEKAVYELAYELGHRPDWVRVPVAGLARLLA